MAARVIKEPAVIKFAHKCVLHQGIGYKVHVLLRIAAICLLRKESVHGIVAILELKHHAIVVPVAFSVFTIVKQDKEWGRFKIRFPL